MKICYIAHAVVPSRTAYGIHVMKMCQAYASLGHQVTLVLPKREEEIKLAEKDIYTFYGVRQEFAIRKVLLPSWCPDLLSFGVVLPLVALRTGPDLAHSRSLTPAWGLTRLFRKATIYELHQPPSQNQRQRALFGQMTASQHLLALVAITSALASRVRPLLPRRVRLLIAPDGVEAGWMQQSMSTAEARAKLGLQGERGPIAVYTGHLYPGRGVDLIVDLARHLADHLFLVVGGQEADVARYRRQVGRLPNLRLVGFKPPAQVFLYLQAADVLLMPYNHRVGVDGGGNTAAFASPMKMFEYMAAGRPILASTLPVLQEVLQDGVNALLLPYDQPRRWVETLRRLQHDSELATKLGRQAHSDVRPHTWENRAQRLLEQVKMIDNL